MTKLLSYPALKIILEFLDPIKRFHITARSASMQRFEKSIPIRVMSLFTNSNCLCLDYMAVSSSATGEIDFRLRGKSYLIRSWVRSIPLKLPIKEITRKMNNLYLGRRKNFYSASVIFADPFLQLSLPENFKVLTKGVETFGNLFEEYIPIIDTRSFPLKYLGAKLTEPAHLSHPALRSLEKLDVEEGFNGMLQLIEEKTPCKYVNFCSDTVPTEDILNLLRKWQKIGKEVGTTFEFVDYEEDPEFSKFPRLMETFSQYKNKKYNKTSESPFFIIPIAGVASNICVFNDDEEQQIIIKIVSTRKEKREGKEINHVASKKTRTT